MGKSLSVGVIALCALATMPVQAKTGDMFTDQGFTVQSRPSVPSDQNYGYASHPDMFPPQAPYVRTDKDMFDSVPKASDPNIEQRFSAHGSIQAPPGRLFQDPNEAR